MPIRTVLCALVLSLCSAHAANAQPIVTEVKLGLNFSTVSVSGPGAFDPNSGTGVMGGVGFGIKVTDIVSLQPEFLYGSRAFSGSTGLAEFDVSARAVELPVLLFFRPGAASHFRIGVGPHFAVIHKVTQKVAGTEADISDDIRDFDAGIAGGLAYDTGDKRGVVIEARASAGFRNLSEAAGTSLKSRSLALFVGYRF